MPERIDEVEPNTDWSRPIGYFIRLDVNREGKTWDAWLTTEQARELASRLVEEADHADEMNRQVDELARDAAAKGEGFPPG